VLVLQKASGKKELTKVQDVQATHTPTVVQGGGVDGPPLGFRSVRAERNKFTLIE